jgi:quinoprotein glucose dehydrogenase
MKQCLLLGCGLFLLCGPSLRAQDPRSYQVTAVDRDPRVCLPADEKKLFVLPRGFEIELVAAEPLVINPITMALDEKGRLYVSESHTYRYGPGGSPVKPFSNPIVRLDPLPDGKGYKRVQVADGFEEPVMGLAIRDGKLWCTANNFLYRFDLSEDGKATNRRTLLVDKNKAWNPFGMFVLEWGPDGLLYMSVGNHNIDIGGPTNRIGGRGSSGIVLRMKPDGSDLERLVHGLRVPYSFEYDPFGQLWLLSNGEGNPDRFVRVLEGVDYHCYSRGGVDNAWLAGRHPLAPPCFELHRGAHTQLIRYYGSAFPAEYQGSLLLDNWGAHGFGGANRAVFRFVPDDKGNIVAKQAFLSCTDPHFRPSHIVLDPDGNLLVADWYGRDDESDLTGRIWRVRYTGGDKPVVKHKLDSADWAQDDYALSALGSPHHLIREKAGNELIHRGNSVAAKLAERAAGGEPLGAANALWALVRIGTPESRAMLAAGSKHADWHVRRLSMNLLRRYQVPAAEEVARQLAADKEPAVRVEAALGHAQPAEVRAALVDALDHGAAEDAHLRYEAAWHLAKVMDAETLRKLLAAPREPLRLAGLIALDVACYEKVPTKALALETLAGALRESSNPADTELLLTLAQLNGGKDKAVVASLEKLLGREDVPPAVTARALLVLRSQGAEASRLTAAVGKRFLEAVDKGTVRLAAPSDQLLLLEVLESEGPSAVALRQLEAHLTSGQPAVRAAAHALARKFETKAAPLAAKAWPRVLDIRANPETRIELMATLARIETPPSAAKWEKLLADPDATVRIEALRDWRAFKGQPDMTTLLVGCSADLLEKDKSLKDDLGAVLRHLEADAAAIGKLGLPAPADDKNALAGQTLAALAALAPQERPRRVLLGRQVFERTGCVKCHTTVTQNTPLAPSLKGIATAQKPDYLVESVLYPSKIIKTGYDTELIATKDGGSLTGLVREDGAFLRILTADRETRIARKDVEERSIRKVSIVPEGQEKPMSRREFLDLMAYLASLK